MDSRKSRNAVFEYVQTGLRSATDIYKEGGQVIQKYSDRSFSLEYDNKRRVIEIEKHGFYDTVP